MNMFFFVTVGALGLFLNILDATIIIQAPKYVPKMTLEGVIIKYLKEIQGIRDLTHKNIEIEVPIRAGDFPNYRASLDSKSMRKKISDKKSLRQRPDVARAKEIISKIQPTSIRPFIQKQTTNAYQTAQEMAKTQAMSMAQSLAQSMAQQQKRQKMQSWAQSQLAQAAAAAQQTQQQNQQPNQQIQQQYQQAQQQYQQAQQQYQLAQQQNQQAQQQQLALQQYQQAQQQYPHMPQTLTRRLMQNFGTRRSYGQQMVYQEDLDKALKELEERLKTGKRPVYMEDLRNALEDFEKRYRQRQEFYATSTPSPCAEESIIKEALKPALKEDLWNFLKPQNPPWSKRRRLSKFKTKRSFLSLEKDIATEMVQRALREEFLDNYRRQVDNDLFHLMEKDTDNNATVEPATDPGSEDEEESKPIMIEIPNRYKYMILKSDKKGKKV